MSARRREVPQFDAFFFLRRLWGVVQVGTLRRGCFVWRARCPIHIACGQALTITDSLQGNVASFHAECGCLLSTVARFVELPSNQELEMSYADRMAARRERP